jgi:hypothetical protein
VSALLLVLLLVLLAANLQVKFLSSACYNYNKEAHQISMPGLFKGKQQAGAMAALPTHCTNMSSFPAAICAPLA